MQHVAELVPVMGGLACNLQLRLRSLQPECTRTVHRRATIAVPDGPVRYYCRVMQKHRHVHLRGRAVGRVSSGVTN